MAILRNTARTFNWQQRGWPGASVNRRLLRAELSDFTAAFRKVQKALWKSPAEKPADIALKAAMLHPHFESIHPFEDGNGRVGRALVAKTLAEGLGLPLILPVSAIIARHRVAYYDEINEASRSLDWTNWAAFFIPVLTEVLTSFLSDLCEPIEPLNDPLNDRLVKLIDAHPGVRLPYLKSVVGASAATVKRVLAVLVAAGRVEHRGSKKTGGYFVVK